MKNLIYFVIGLSILTFITAQNIIKLTSHTLVSGQKPIFDIDQKVAAGGVLVHNGMTGETEVL